MSEINSINNLEGWRSLKPDEECLKGLLYRDAQTSKKSGGILVIFLFLFSYAFLNLSWMGIQGTIKDVQSGNMDDLLISVLIILVVSALGILSGIFGIKCLIQDDAKVFRKAIIENRIRVVDVEICKVISIHGVGDGVDGHVVKVQDLYGNICGRNISFSCRNGYKKTRGILLEVKLSELNPKFNNIVRVVPCEEFDEKLWKVCKNYYKNVPIK